MALLKNKSIAEWSDGDLVEGFCLLSRLERRQDRNGNTFLDLTLNDATGTIAGKVWSDSPALEGDFKLFGFVAVRGTVKDYRGRLQVSLQRCRAVTDADRAEGFDEALLVPTTPYDISELYGRLEKVLNEKIEDPQLRRLALETLAVHGPALREHPAAKAIHHAYRGGLIEHVVTMAELINRVADQYPQLNRGIMIVGVLFHDLGKLVELGAMPANEYSQQGRMIGHIVMGRDLLRDACSKIEGFPEDTRLHLEHLVLSHHGELEFGSPVLPMTAEAIALAFVDNLDSKLNQVWEAARLGGGMQFLRGFNRYIVLPDLEGQEEATEEEKDDGPAQVALDL